MAHEHSSREWILNLELFNVINQQWGPLEVDLFASRFSAQLLHFYSWRPDPEAEATNAFAQDWSTKRGYAHPPCMVFDNSGAVQGAGSASLPSAGGTSLANTSLVPCSSINAGGHSYPAPKEAGHFDSIPQLRLSRQEAISEEAIKLILGSRREKTNANL